MPSGDAGGADLRDRLWRRRRDLWEVFGDDGAWIIAPYTLPRCAGAVAGPARRQNQDAGPRGDGARSHRSRYRAREGGGALEERQPPPPAQPRQGFGALCLKERDC